MVAVGLVGFVVDVGEAFPVRVEGLPVSEGTWAAGAVRGVDEVEYVDLGALGGEEPGYVGQPLGVGHCRALAIEGDVPHASPSSHRAASPDHLCGPMGAGEFTADVGQPAGGAETLVGVARLFEQLPGGLGLVESGGEQSGGVSVAARERDYSSVDAT